MAVNDYSQPLFPHSPHSLKHLNEPPVLCVCVWGTIAAGGLPPVWANYLYLLLSSQLLWNQHRGGGTEITLAATSSTYARVFVQEIRSSSQSLRWFWQRRKKSLCQLALHSGLQPSRPGHNLFQLLPSGRHYRALYTKKNQTSVQCLSITYLFHNLLQQFCSLYHCTSAHINTLYMLLLSVFRVSREQRQKHSLDPFMFLAVAQG